LTFKHRRLIVMAMVVVVVAGCSHTILLRLASLPLVAKEPSGQFDYVGLLPWGNGVDGQESYPVAAELLRQKSVRGILLFNAPHDRLVEIGVLPSREAVICQELKLLKVGKDAITAFPCQAAQDDWATARAVKTWLAKNPTANIILMCNRFRSAHLRDALDKTLDVADAERVGVQGVADRDIDETNWWKSRDGFKAFGVGWLRRMHGWCVGGRQEVPKLEDADGYERTFLETRATPRQAL
jgi:hypothetical protein